MQKFVAFLERFRAWVHGATHKSAVARGVAALNEAKAALRDLIAEEEDVLRTIIPDGRAALDEMIEAHEKLRNGEAEARQRLYDARFPKEIESLFSNALRASMLEERETLLHAGEKFDAIVDAVTSKIEVRRKAVAQIEAFAEMVFAPVKA